MKKDRHCNNLIICLIFLITLLSSHIILESFHILKEVTADNREFEAEEFEENLIIQPNNLGTIDLDLQDGEEIEVIFTLQVKEALPVDLWFLNEEHYLLLVNGAQFLFFIDGSEQEVTYTRKIVSLTEHDVYKLVIANYNNQTVETDIVYEIRTYYAPSSETSSEDLPIFFYFLISAIVILVVLVLVLLVKIRGYKRADTKVTKKSPIKRPKTRKIKKAKTRVIEKDEKVSHKKRMGTESGQELAKTSEKATPSFCGNCGNSITSPFCTYCGNKVAVP